MNSFFFHYHDIMYSKLDYNLYSRILNENKKIFLEKCNDNKEIIYRFELFIKFMRKLFIQYNHKNIITQSMTEQMALSILHFNVKIFIGLIYLQNINILKKLENICSKNEDLIKLKDIIRFYDKEKKYKEIYPLITNLYDNDIMIKFENELNYKKKCVSKIYNFYINYKKIRKFRLSFRTISCISKRFPKDIVHLIFNYFIKLNGIEELNFYVKNQNDINLILDQCKLSNCNENIIIVVKEFIKCDCDIVDTILTIYDKMKID